MIILWTLSGCQCGCWAIQLRVSPWLHAKKFPASINQKLLIAVAPQILASYAEVIVFTHWDHVEIITKCKKLCCLEYPALLPWWWETRWQNVEVPHLYREFTCNTCTTEHIHALNSSNHLESSTSIPRIAHCFVRLYCVTNSHRGTPSASQTTRMRECSLWKKCIEQLCTHNCEILMILWGCTRSYNFIQVHM